MKSIRGFLKWLNEMDNLLGVLTTLALVFIGTQVVAWFVLLVLSYSGMVLPVVTGVLYAAAPATVAYAIIQYRKR